MDIKEKMKQWGLLKSGKDRLLFAKIDRLLFIEKCSLYGQHLVKILPLLWQNIATKTLISEEECKKLIDKEEDREVQIFIADTYLHMKVGIQHLQRANLFDFNS